MSKARNLAAFVANVLGVGGTAADARAGMAVPFELIENRTITSPVSSVEFTSFPAGFDRFRLEVDGVAPTADDTQFIVQLFVAGSWVVGGYGYIGLLIGQTAAVHFSATSEGSGQMVLATWGAGNKVGNAAGESLSASVEFNPKDTSSRRRFRIESDWTRPDGLDMGAKIIGSYGSSAAATGIRIVPSASTFKSGNVKLFGIRA
ncbi:MAG: hypothetical protein O9972_13070 [Burkholderiales bacterium]|nr:hypothetical protein [Burkholderiales bacterium]